MKATAYIDVRAVGDAGTQWRFITIVVVVKYPCIAVGKRLVVRVLANRYPGSRVAAKFIRILKRERVWIASENTRPRVFRVLRPSQDPMLSRRVVGHVQRKPLRIADMPVLTLADLKCSTQRVRIAQVSVVTQQVDDASCASCSYPTSCPVWFTRQVIIGRFVRKQGRKC